MLVGLDAQQRRIQIGSLCEPVFAQILNGLTSATTGVENDEWIGLTIRQFEKIVDGLDDTVLGREIALRNSGKFAQWYSPIILQAVNVM